MKVLASIIFGLMGGWLVVHADIFLPQNITDLIGNGVAGSASIKAITNLLATEGIPSRTIHFWTLALSLSVIQIFTISALSVVVSSITKRSRAIVYSTLAYPISIVFGSFYVGKNIYISNPKLGAYFLSSARDQALLYIFSFMVFFVFFYSINLCAKTLSSRA